MAYAGQRFIEAIMDNPLTSGWSDLIAGRLVRPIERIGMDDATYRTEVAKQAAQALGSQDAGAFNPAAEAALRRAASLGGADPEWVNQQAAGLGAMGDTIRKDEFAGLLEHLLSGGQRRDPQKMASEAADMADAQPGAATAANQPVVPVDRQRLVQAEADLVGPGAALTQVGGGVHAVLGNPIAAYGATAGAGALGVMGVLELLRRYREGQGQGSDVELQEEEAPVVTGAGDGQLMGIS